jgi:hypothetical protein
LYDLIVNEEARACKVSLSADSELEQGHPEVILANNCGNRNVSFMKGNDVGEISRPIGLAFIAVLR